MIQRPDAINAILEKMIQQARKQAGGEVVLISHEAILVRRYVQELEARLGEEAEHGPIVKET